jgi:flagellar biosynthesis GTPase FlhF
LANRSFFYRIIVKTYIFKREGKVNMRHKILKMSLAMVLMSSTIIAGAAEVYTWRDKKGINEYSDAPVQLTPAKANRFNIRTQASTPLATPQPDAQASSDSLSEQQAQLNRKIEEQNKLREEENKKIAEQNKKNREAACKTAKLNRNMADSLRTNNRDALIQRYDEDVRINCN